MFYWIYDIPAWTAAALFAATFVGMNRFGTIFVCPLLRRFFHKQAGWNDIVGYFLSFFSVLYGLLLGLLAVATYQNLSDVDKAVALEATALASALSGRFVLSRIQSHRAALPSKGIHALRYRGGLAPPTPRE